MASSSFAPTLCFSLSSEFLQSQKPNSLSWSSSLPQLNISSSSSSTPFPSNLSLHQKFVVEAAWTRRSRSEAAKKPNRKSWKQRTDMYMRPFLLNVFFSKRFIHAKVMHRGTSKVISVATTNARDLRNTLPSLTDNDAARVIGQLIAERSKEADVYAIAYEPGKNERIEGRLGIILDTIQKNGIIFV
ncbi:50S ribosomal protein L18 [Capsicum galapagoense]